MPNGAKSRPHRRPASAPPPQRRAAGQRHRQRAIDQPTRQPAPEHAERESLPRGPRRQEAPGERLDVAPEARPRRLAKSRRCGLPPSDRKPRATSIRLARRKSTKRAGSVLESATPAFPRACRPAPRPTRSWRSARRCAPIAVRHAARPPSITPDDSATHADNGFRQASRSETAIDRSIQASRKAMTERAGKFNRLGHGVLPYRESRAAGQTALSGRWFKLLNPRVPLVFRALPARRPHEHHSENTR